MSEEKKETIVFGAQQIPEDQKALYKSKIESAKIGVNALKGVEPLGKDRTNMPDFSKLKEAQSSKRVNSPFQEGVQPRPPGSPMLSPHTQQQLQEIAKMPQEEQKQPEPVKEEKATEKEPENLFDVLDFEGLKKNEAERLLDNKKRRDEIESRCEPMKFEDLLYKNEVRQRVPIIPEKFEPLFRSLTPAESLFVKKFIADESSVSDQYLMEKFSICVLAAALVDINGKALPDHLNSDGEVNKEAFQKKLKELMKKSGYIIGDLVLNYGWFDIRVRKLISLDGIKNG